MKIYLSTLVFLLVSLVSRADVCTSSDTQSGSDQSGFTATVTDFTCVGANPIVSATLDATIGPNCTFGGGNWYYYNIIVNGSTVATAQCDQTGFDLTPYLPLTSVVIQAVDDPADGIIDNVTLTLDVNLTYFPPCSNPTNLTATNVLPTSADLNWDAVTGAVDYDVEWGFLGFSPGTGGEEGSALNVAGLTTNTTGLNPQTIYDFYVQTDCGGSGTSAWAGPFQFETPCAASVAPWMENFTTTSTPACWDQFTTTGGPWVFTGNPDFGTNPTIVDHTSGVANNYAWVDQSGTDVGVILQTPLIDVSALTTPYLSAWIMSHNNSGSVATFNEIHVEANDGVGGWTPVDVISGDFGFQWIEFGYDVSSYVYSGNFVQFRFRAESGGDGFDYDNDMLLDDVSVQEAPSCFTPASLVASNGTTTSIGLDWTETGTATQWFVEYGPSGFTPGTGTSVAASTNPFLLTGLNPNEFYDVYVRSFCGVGDTSDYAGPASFNTYDVAAYTSMDFNTDCPVGGFNDISTTGLDLGLTDDGETGVTLDFPIVFQGLVITEMTVGNNGGIDLGTLTGAVGYGGNMNTLDDGLHPWGDDLDEETGNVYYEVVGTAPNRTMIVQWDNICNFAGALGDPTVTFQVQMKETTNEIFFVYDDVVFGGADAADDFGANADIGVAGPVTDFPVSSNDATFLTNNSCIKFYYPTCPKPFDLTQVEVNDDTIIFSWTPGNSETEWEVEYGPEGFTPGTGTVFTTTNTQDTIGSLSSLTAYDVYVTAVCSVSDSSSAAGPLTISTEISPLNCTAGDPTVVLMEDFEGGFPADWSQVATADPDWTWDGAGGTTSSNTGPSSAYSGSGFLYLETSGGAVGDSDTLSAPSVNLTSTVGDARATWKYHMYGADMGKMTFEVSTDGILWNEIWSDSGSLQQDELDPWATAQADLTPYVGNIVQMRFVGIGNGTFEGDMAIDTFAVEACISCPDPSNLVASNATTTSVDLAWTIGDSETAWVIEYGPEGFTPGTGTTVNTTNNPETVSGLIDNTIYDFYVYADCGSGDISIPAGPAADTTLIVCAAPTAFAVTYEGQDSLALTWTPGGLESAWTVEYGPIGYTPGTGTSHTATVLPDTTFNIPNGVWEFYVQADCGGGLNNPWTGPILFISPIQNDSSCNSITVPVDGSTTDYANVNATEQVGELTSGFNTVWFDFVAPASGHVEIRTCGTNFDNMLEVYDATDCSGFGTFTLVASATGNPFTTCSGVDPAGLNLCGLTPGNTYYLVVGAENASDEGVFPLSLTELPAVDAGNATPIQICLNDPAVDLYTTITGNLTQNGQWYNPSVGAGNEFAPLLDFTGVPAGVYPFFYVDIELCGSDTVESSVEVVDPPQVGTGSTVTAGCNYGQITLWDALSGTVEFGGTWYDESSTDLGTGSVVFDGEPAGSYNYYYVVDNGVCPADTATVVVDVIDCTGINENTLNLDVYPNPVRDVLYIKLDELDNNTTIQLIDLNGRVVTAPIAILTNTATIDVSELSDGIYFVRVTTGYASKEVRVVKQ